MTEETELLIVKDEAPVTLQALAENTKEIKEESDNSTAKGKLTDGAVYDGANLGDTWERYREFEELEYNNSLGLANFLSEWETRLSKASPDGCLYSDTILAFKLLEKCQLAPRDVKVFLTLLGSSCESGTDLYLQTLSYICKAFEIIGSSGDQDIKKEEDIVSFDQVGDKVAGKMIQMLKSNRINDENGKLDESLLESTWAWDDGIENQQTIGRGKRKNQRTTVIGAKRSRLDDYASPEEVSDDDDMPSDGGDDDWGTEDTTDVKPNKDFGAKKRRTPTRSLTCDKCSYVTNLTHNLMRHKQSKHNIAPEYRCSVPSCDFVGANCSVLKEHKRAMHKQPRNVCKDCDFVAFNHYRLKQHAQREHGAASFACDQCDHVAVSLSNLRTHKLAHEPADAAASHICDECGYSAKHLAQLKKHKQIKHESEPGHVFSCNQCNYVTREKGSLKIHMQCVHDNLRLEPCDQCDYVAHTRGKLRVHKRIKHEKIRYSCQLCPFSAVTNSDLTKHRQVYHEGIRHTCNMCDYVATKKHNLKLHIENKHQGVRFPCDRCDKKFTKKGILKRHVESVHEGITYLCDKCDYVSTQKAQLVKHQRIKHKL